MVFPQTLRNPYASIGVGVKNVDLHLGRSTTLVGQVKHSWGIDLSSKKVFSNGLLVGKFPNAFFAKLPDRFFMYIDLVDCKLMFGSDGKYYGEAIQDDRMKHYTLYPMVSSAREGAAITMVYRGAGNIYYSTCTSLKAKQHKMICIIFFFRDRPFNLQRRVMVFCFVQNFFSDNT